MASTRTKTWGQPTPPSSAFLIKCAKEKEKLRSKFRKQLQEQMLYMLNNAIHTNILLGIDVGQGSFGETRILDLNSEINSNTIGVHKSVLKVRTPAFLDHVQKYKELNATEEFPTFHTYLRKEELKDFLKKVYTDDDIRKHECEALRLSKTHIETLCDKKSFLNKHISDTDEFPDKSLNSAYTENFVTPKTSPLTPNKLLDLPDILQMRQNSCKLKTVDRNDNMPKKLQGSNKTSLKSNHNAPENYIDELVHLHNEPSSNNVKPPLLHLNSSEMNSTSIYNMDKPVLDDLCSPGTEPDLEDSSSSSPSASGMVRSNTFDLHTQAPLEAFIDRLEDDSNNNALLSSHHKLESFHGLEDSIELEATTKSENSSFFLHDDDVLSPKPNLFSLIDNHANVHIRKTDGSMSDSGFMSYSAISEMGLSSSLVLSDSTMSPHPTSANTDESLNLEKAKRLSGSMFPFYIDINNLPLDKVNRREEEERKSSSVYMFIDAKKPNLKTNDIKRSDLNLSKSVLARSRNSDTNYGNLTKAVSSPHLHYSHDNASPLPFNVSSSRPQSCYMYIDLDSVEEKSYPSVKRGPSSISMYVDLNDDSLLSSEEKKHEDNDINLRNLNETKILKKKNSPVTSEKSNCLNTSESKRKLSDTYLVKSDKDISKIRFHSLRKPNENLSDSELNNLANKDQISMQTNINGDNVRSLQSSLDISFLGDIYSKIECSELSTFKPKFPNTDPILSSLNNYNDSCLKDEQSEIKFLNTLYNDLMLPHEKSKLVESEGKKNQDAIKETGLLPMSPILRRKTPKKNETKLPSPIKVKASTLPQDVDAMKFPVSEKDDPVKTINVKNIFQKNNSTHMSSDSLHQKSDDVDDSKSSNESSKLEEEHHVTNLPNKIPDQVSCSESSNVNVSTGETTSSDKVFASDTSKDHGKSSSAYFQCEFDDDVETIYSEVSDLSSSLGGLSGVASLERRWREGYTLAKDVSSHGIHNMYRVLEACSKLGEDMLRMFLEEIDTDIVIEVDGYSIKAHRCILVSRCKYFASLLKDDCFINGEPINLEGFSYLSVHFALCHIYSGAINLPKDTNIIELGLLADILSLDTLTDVIILHLRTHYCHFFHKPCPQCTQGVIECLPLAVTCGFNDLVDKCIHWLGKYFTKTWTNKMFAALPEDLRNQCFQNTVKNLTVETAIEMTLSCDRIITTLPHLKWTEPIFGMVSNLLQECIYFMANNFNKILCSEGFLVLGKGQSWNVSALDDDIMSSVELMTPDVACKSCVKINQILTLAESGGGPEYGEFTQNFIELLHKINRGCERYLIHNANKVVHCQSWSCLPSEVQKKVKDAAVIVFEFEKPTAKPPRLSSLQRKTRKQGKDGDNYGYFENSTYPKPFRNGRNYSNDFCERTFCIQKKGDKESKDSDHTNKKLVSPIKEESQANAPNSRKSIDFHEEDSLREMQDLPHDQSSLSQHIYLDASQTSNNSIGNIELEDTHSCGKDCSDNPDSLDANDDISMDSKDELENSMHIEDDFDKVSGTAVTEIINHLHSSNAEKVPANAINDSPLFHSSRTISVANEKLVTSKINKIPKAYDTSPTKRSPIKSYVPLSTTHIVQEKDSFFQSKDLVAEIDADSRMVTHCLQEAEMLEQQLSRKLHQQKTGSSPNKLPYNQSGNNIPCIDIRKSSRMTASRVQKSLSTSQMKNLIPASVRIKSPGKMTPSPSSPHVARIGRTTEVVREMKSSTKKIVPSSKINLIPTQKPFRSNDNVCNSQKLTAPSKRVSTKQVRSRSSVITAVRDNRNANVGPK